MGGAVVETGTILARVGRSIQENLCRPWIAAKVTAIYCDLLILDLGQSCDRNSPISFRKI